MLHTVENIPIQWLPCCIYSFMSINTSFTMYKLQAIKLKAVLHIDLLKYSHTFVTINSFIKWWMFIKHK